MNYQGYFLIVADFIQWAKAQGIPVGPGRGSGAGSLVAYALTITDLDPMRFGLLFERFLNPERVSMPDFDIDFCQDRRDEVIAYVRERYGAHRVAHIITFGKLRPAPYCATSAACCRCPTAKSTGCASSCR
jgi:DNA polymerase-3 subunit alpha